MDEHVETTLVGAGRPGGPGAPMSPPIVASSTYHAGGALGYGRDGNPTWEPLEELMGLLEGGHAVSFGSGLATCAAVFDGVPAGGLVVAPRSAYFGVTEQLRSREATGRIAVRWVDGGVPGQVAAALDGASLLWLETPSNPMMTISDIAAAAAARPAGCVLVVDNTFATPLLQRPIDLGADVVVHSATKYVGGHADLLLGIAVCARAEDADALRGVRYREGAVPGALEAFLALRGARTLAVRLDRAQANAGELARRLSGHARVTCVRYPGLPDDPGHALASRQMRGFGAMLSFEVEGGAAAADALCARVRRIVSATSLGSVETLIERRAHYESERENGTPESLLRLSVGIEHVDDLWDDLSAGLDAH